MNLDRAKAFSSYQDATFDLAWRAKSLVYR